MNLTKTEKVRLGTFIIVAVSLLVASVLVLAGLKVWERRDLYTVRFSENVAGLERSAQVKYQGLRVGRVEKMEIAADDPSVIEVTLSLEAGTPLHNGTEAVLELSGITGLKVVNLRPGDPRAGRIAPGSRLPASKSLMDRITGQAEVIAEKVEVVANNLAIWTGEENRKRVERTLDAVHKLVSDVDVLVVEARPSVVATLEAVPEATKAVTRVANESSKTLADIREDLRLTLEATRTSLVEVRRILRAVESDKVRDTVAAANSAMRHLDQRLSDEQLGKSIVALQAALTQLTGLLQELDLAVRASREDFVSSLKHVRQATEDLREFSRIIAQDPSVLLRGREVGD